MVVLEALLGSRRSWDFSPTTPFPPPGLWGEEGVAGEFHNRLTHRTMVEANTSNQILATRLFEQIGKFPA